MPGNSNKKGKTLPWAALAGAGSLLICGMAKNCSSPPSPFIPGEGKTIQMGMPPSVIMGSPEGRPAAESFLNNLLSSEAVDFVRDKLDSQMPLQIGGTTKNFRVIQIKMEESPKAREHLFARSRCNSGNSHALFSVVLNEEGTSTILISKVKLNLAWSLGCGSGSSAAVRVSEEWGVGGAKWICGNPKNFRGKTGVSLDKKMFHAPGNKGRMPAPKAPKHTHRKMKRKCGA